MTKSKNILLWAVAVVLAISIIIYQRTTGPTYPKKGEIEFAETVVEFELPRTSESSEGEPILIEAPEHIYGYMQYRRYKSFDDTTTVELVRDGKQLKTTIPHQPAAGKVEYKIFLHDGNEIKSLTDENVVIRYKGYVPRFVLFPHIAAMIFSIFVAFRVILELMVKGPNVYKYSLYALVVLAFGGLFLGPLVQKFAFDAYWTGWPFGHDLTDNKTIFTILIWVIAVWKMKKSGANKWWVLAAALVQLTVYLIPHSAFGSEIDYTQTPEAQ